MFCYCFFFYCCGDHLVLHRLTPSYPPRRSSELVDGGAALPEIGHHLGRNLGRKGRDAARRHAVVAGENQDMQVFKLRFRPLLPGRQMKDAEIGRASCRERVCQYVSISVDAASLQHNPHQPPHTPPPTPPTTNPP